jgi:hypothetical protein
MVYYYYLDVSGEVGLGILGKLKAPGAFLEK